MIMSKKLCWFLDIIYFFIILLLVYNKYSAYHYIHFSDHNAVIMNELQRLIFYGKDVLIFIFAALATLLIDFSFVSKVLTHFKYNKKTEKRVFITLIISVIIAFVVLHMYHIFIVGNYRGIFFLRWVV